MVPKKSLKFFLATLVKGLTMINSMKITLLTPALAAVLGFALASVPMTVSAESTTAPAKTAKAMGPHYAGTLTAVDTAANTITVQTKKDGDKTVTIAPTTKIKKDKKAATLADFAVGDKVNVSYTETAGVLTATTLTSGGGKPASSKTTKTTPAPAAAPASTPAQ